MDFPAGQSANTTSVQLPEVKDYLEHGPSFIFLFHPSLGPLWDVVAQKVQGGSLAAKSEMVLEVAEACLSQVHVDGSLRVQADSVMGGSEHALAVNYNQIRSRHDLQLRQRSSRMLWSASPALLACSPAPPTMPNCADKLDIPLIVICCQKILMSAFVTGMNLLGALSYT